MEKHFEITGVKKELYYRLFLGMPEIVEAGTEGFVQGAKWMLDEFRKFLDNKIETYNQEADKWFSTKNLETVGVISKVRVDTVKEIIKEFFDYDL